MKTKSMKTKLDMQTILAGAIVVLMIVLFIETLIHIWVCDHKFEMPAFDDRVVVKPEHLSNAFSELARSIRIPGSRSPSHAARVGRAPLMLR